MFVVFQFGVVHGGGENFFEFLGDVVFQPHALLQRGRLAAGVFEVGKLVDERPFQLVKRRGRQSQAGDEFRTVFHIIVQLLPRPRRGFVQRYKFGISKHQQHYQHAHCPKQEPNHHISSSWLTNGPIIIKMKVAV